MCIMCEIGKAIEAEEKKGTEVIGTVSEQLRVDFKAHKTAEALADLDIDQQVLNARRALLLDEINDAQVEERQEVIDALRKADAEKFEAVHTALWERVYEELGLIGKERDRDYSINALTGEISTKKRQGFQVFQGGGLH